MNFGKHAEHVINKINKIHQKLSFLGNRTWGLNYRQRIILYKGVARAVLGYCASVYFPRLRKVYKLKLRSLNRKWLLRTIQGYGTISFEAVDIIARVLPLDWFFFKRILLTKYRQYLHSQSQVTDTQFGLRFENSKAYDIEDNLEVNFKNITQKIHKHIYNKWQEQWDSSHKGRTTHKFFPSVENRMLKKNVKINFYLTQVFSGHGNFSAYLHRFTVKDNPTCTNCQKCETENVEHMLFNCPAWTELKQKYKIEHALSAQTLEKISGKDNFSAFAQHVMKIKNKS
ncbi:UNVERIFIED_CONTAM: hypothetical protein PYX00_008769 [Menopon gallinae]|uniref:Reverse transcriptase zinc-binding domain-containing protein n=1 Tax=Menopon gallinae TaxID=328185 RepID=A0AAW2HP68_9NEOP